MSCCTSCRVVHAIWADTNTTMDAEAATRVTGEAVKRERTTSNPSAIIRLNHGNQPAMCRDVCNLPNWETIPIKQPRTMHQNSARSRTVVQKAATNRRTRAKEKSGPGSPMGVNETKERQ